LIKYKKGRLIPSLSSIGALLTANIPEAPIELSLLTVSAPFSSLDIWDWTLRFPACFTQSNPESLGIIRPSFLIYHGERLYGWDTEYSQMYQNSAEVASVPQTCYG